MVNEKYKICIVQINNNFSNHSYLPYVSGLIEGYVTKYAISPNKFEFEIPIYKREHIDVYLEKLANTDVIGFSLYVWNYKISLALAKRLKELDKNKLIIFGGPQVPDNPENFLRENPFIDVVVHGEGEQIALDIFEAMPGNDWENIPSISYKVGQSIVTHPRADRRKTIDDIPSPYNSGTFDKIINAYPEENWIMLWETNRGCPFSCSFCDWGSLVQAKVLNFSIDRLYSEIDWMSEKKIEYVYCCDANYGILPRDIELTQKTCSNKREFGYPIKMGVQNTKNSTERAYTTQKLLNEGGLSTGVDLALQSLNTETLKAIKRDNISLETYEILQKRFTQDGIMTFTDLIFALPGETYETFADGVSQIIKNGQHNRIQFNPLAILPNAEMGSTDYQELHQLKTIEARNYNMHGGNDDIKDGIFEMQSLVVETKTLSREMWRQGRVFSWLTSMLHFNKLLQIPFLVIHSEENITFRDIIEAFMFGLTDKCVLLKKIKASLEEHAQVVQDGGPEFVFSPEYLELYWPIDELWLIKLVIEDNLDQFYVEALETLSSLVRDDFPKSLLKDAIKLNKKLLKLPQQSKDDLVELDYDLITFYRSIRDGKESIIKGGLNTQKIIKSDSVWETKEDWMRQVIWHQNKSGGYLYEKVLPTNA
jgi:radical SAM superfamily enzyme YgiQ (UPF0313 family)